MLWVEDAKIFVVVPHGVKIKDLPSVSARRTARAQISIAEKGVLDRAINPEIGSARDAVGQALGELAVRIDGYLLALGGIGVETDVGQVEDFGGEI